MTSGKPVKLILLFALPLIVGNIFQQFYSMADTVIVGRTIGVNALAAVGCTGSVSFFILGFVMGFTSGLSILIAQRFGAEDEEGIRCSFAAGIILSIALTIVMTLFAVALVRPAMEFLQTPEEILDDAVSYIRIIFWGIGASVLFNLGSNTMRHSPWHRRQSDPTVFSDFCLLCQYCTGHCTDCRSRYGSCRGRCGNYIFSAPVRNLLLCIYMEENAGTSD